MSISRLTRAAVAAATLVSPALSDVIDVRGPSPDFDQIAPAVQAAADGDVLRIWPGVYESFWVNDKSLSLVRATSSGVITVDGTIRIRNLSSDRRVEMAGVGATGTDGYALVVSDCRGPVRIREGDFVGASGTIATSYWPYDAVFVTGSADVVFTNCTARGGDPCSGECGGDGASGLTTTASTVSLYASTWRGSSGTTWDDPGESGGSGGHGVVAWETGTIFISGCTLIGGNGSNADWDVDWWTGEYGYGGWGGYGFYSEDHAEETWLLDNDYQPGWAGSSPDSSKNGEPGEDTNSGTFLPGTARIFRASRLIDDQSALALRFEGEPGDRVYVSQARGPGYRFSPLHGPLLVDVPPSPVAMPWRCVGVLGASGALVTTQPQGDLPPLGHVTPHFAALFVDGVNDYYGSSSWTVVLDSAW